MSKAHKELRAGVRHVYAISSATGAAYRLLIADRAGQPATVAKECKRLESAASAIADIEVPNERNSEEWLVSKWGAVRQAFRSARQLLQEARL